MDKWPFILGRLGAGRASAEAAPPDTAAAPEAPEAPAPLPSDELDQLVAPIALYPDALVAQILAGSTYPTEVVEAARWQSANPGLSGDNLAAAVDSTDWDPSIKALTQFPSVLANMNNNLSWTSALGQAYYYQPEDVLKRGSGDAPKSARRQDTGEHARNNGTSIRMT